MIVYITPQNKHLYKSQLKEMYSLRHRIFKENLKWDVESIQGLEKDEFDHQDAHYILYLNGSKKVKGCMRVIPTTKYYMIRSIFSYLMTSQLYHNSSIWEVSRFALDRSEQKNVRLRGVNQITYELYAALMEFGLANQIQKYIFVGTLSIERLLKKIGWVPERLSKVVNIGGIKSILGSIKVDPEIFIHLVFEGKLTPFFSLNKAKIEKNDLMNNRKKAS